MADFDIHAKPGTEAQRDALRLLIQGQVQETLDDMTAVTCPCGKKIRLAYGYRCYFCKIVLCPSCAEKHFGSGADHPETFERLARAALRLDGYLRAAVGHSSDWPVRLSVDNTADADQLSALLSDFSQACKAHEQAQTGEPA